MAVDPRIKQIHEVLINKIDEAVAEAQDELHNLEPDGENYCIDAVTVAAISPHDGPPIVEMASLFAKRAFVKTSSETLAYIADKEPVETDLAGIHPEDLFAATVDITQSSTNLFGFE